MAERNQDKGSVTLDLCPGPPWTRFLSQLNLTTSEASSAQDFLGSGLGASFGTKASIALILLSQLQGVS